MSTVGYGDISPVNFKEKIYAIIMLEIACGIFAYSINSIGIIFQEMHQNSNHFKFF